jgi:Flp pilus assembly protein TadB
MTRAWAQVARALQANKDGDAEIEKFIVEMGRERTRLQVQCFIVNTMLLLLLLLLLVAVVVVAVVVVAVVVVVVVVVVVLAAARWILRREKKTLF